MPLTPNRSFKREPRIFTSAEGVYYTTSDGRTVLDASSGLYCCPAGHARLEIARAIHEQLLSLDYAPSMQYGHPAAFELARKVADISPQSINHVFFVNSGSEGVDTAMKSALKYHRARGEAQRTRFVSRERSYHGMNIGGTSLAGIARNRETTSLLAGVSHIRHTLLEENRKILGQPEYGAHLADDLMRHIELYGAENIAACIVEPVTGAGGVIPPPRGYLERLREICTAHRLLLIFDEVISGFGRLGAPFAAQCFGVTPDIIISAKALTNGTVPMGAVAVSDDIYDTIVNAGKSDDSVEFSHGYTFSAHPVACAAALAALRIFRDESLFERAAKRSEAFLAAIGSLRDLPVVRDVRGYGLLAAIELHPLGKSGAIAREAIRQSFANDLLPRVSGNNIILAPDYVFEDIHFDEMWAKTEATLRGLADTFSRELRS